jgi:enoyl-CoA hydratase/carnithine racemase
MKAPKHFLWTVDGKVGVVTLNRPERKNQLTFDSYAKDFHRAYEAFAAKRKPVFEGD